MLTTYWAVLGSALFGFFMLVKAANTAVRAAQQPAAERKTGFLRAAGLLVIALSVPVAVAAPHINPGRASGAVLAAVLLAIGGGAVVAISHRSARKKDVGG